MQASHQQEESIGQVAICKEIVVNHRSSLEVV